MEAVELTLSLTHTSPRSTGKSLISYCNFIISRFPKSACCSLTTTPLPEYVLLRSMTKITVFLRTDHSQILSNFINHAASYSPNTIDPRVEGRKNHPLYQTLLRMMRCRLLYKLSSINVQSMVPFTSPILTFKSITFCSTTNIQLPRLSIGVDVKHCLLNLLLDIRPKLSLIRTSSWIFGKTYFQQKCGVNGEPGETSF